ncbi:unnamed protein product, partial [Orchesella dallaii]
AHPIAAVSLDHHKSFPPAHHRRYGPGHVHGHGKGIYDPPPPTPHLKPVYPATPPRQGYGSLPPPHGHGVSSPPGNPVIQHVHHHIHRQPASVTVQGPPSS